MALQPLTLKTLGELYDGAAEKMIDQTLAATVRDIEDRGADLKERKVTIIVHLTPNAKREVKMKVECHSTHPKFRTGATVAKIGADALGELALLFQEAAPDNPDQETFAFPDKKTAAAM